MSLAYGFFLPAFPDLGMLVPAQAQFLQATRITPLPGARPGVTGLAATSAGPAIVVGPLSAGPQALADVLVLGAAHSPWGVRLERAPVALDTTVRDPAPEPLYPFQCEPTWASERWWWSIDGPLLRHWLLEEGHNR